MDYEVPEDLKYTHEHEWARIEENNVVQVGITDFAQDSLGDIVFVELPDADEDIIKDDPFGVIESVKTVTDLFAPVTGKVLEVNERILDSPELVNEDPYGDGWLIRVEIDDTTEFDELLSPSDYNKLIQDELEKKEDEDLSDEEE